MVKTVPRPRLRSITALQECVGCETNVIEGNPDPRHISTSFAERQNLTMRMSMRRTRLTKAFSMKVENHALSVALHYMHYNFARIRKTLRVTPAMAAGVTNNFGPSGISLNVGNVGAQQEAKKFACSIWHATD